MTRTEQIENDTRAEIYEEIRDSPGTYFAKLAQTVGVNPSTVRYHSRILERDGRLRTSQYRGRRRLVPASASETRAKVGATLEDEAAKRVLEAIADRKETRAGDIADAIDRDRSTVSHHLSRLVEDGMVEREPRGNEAHFSLEESVRQVLQEDEARPRDAK